MSFMETSWCHINYSLIFLTYFSSVFSTSFIESGRHQDYFGLVVNTSSRHTSCRHKKFGDVKTDDATSLNLSAAPNVDWS